MSLARIGAGEVTGTAATNLLVSALGSIAGLLLARYLGPSARGALVIAITWPSFIGTIGNLGLPQATTYTSASIPSRRRDYLASGTALSLGASLLLSLGGLLMAPLITDSAPVVHELRRLFFAMPIYLVPGVWVSSLQATRIRPWNFARLIQPLVYVPYIVTLQLGDNLTMSTAVDAHLVSLVIQSTATALLVHRIVGFGRVKKTECLELWRYGIRSVTANFPFLVNARLDQLILSLSVSTAALGNYALAVSLSSLALPAASAFGSVAFPRMASALVSDRPKVRKDALRGGAITAAAFALPIALLGPVLIPRIFGPGYERAVACLLILAPAAVILVANQINEDLFRGEGRPLIPAAAELIGSLLTVALLLVLVPPFGIIGAATASLVSYMGITIILIEAYRRRARSVQGNADRDGGSEE